MRTLFVVCCLIAVNALHISLTQWDDADCNQYGLGGRSLMLFSDNYCSTYLTASTSFNVTCLGNTRDAAWILTIYGSNSSCSNDQIVAVTRGAGATCANVAGDTGGWNIDCSDQGIDDTCYAVPAQTCLNYRTDQTGCEADVNCVWCASAGTCQYFRPQLGCSFVDRQANPEVFWMFYQPKMCGTPLCNQTSVNQCLSQSFQNCNDRPTRGCQSCAIKTNPGTHRGCYPEYTEACRFDYEFVYNAPGACPVYSPVFGSPATTLRATAWMLFTLLGLASVVAMQAMHDQR